jgi:3-methyl-2-oxobutanoate hydroxymethyltransferase
MGHIGFTPQSHSQLGGYRVQGKTADAARRLVDQARALQDAGCFALVLEMVPAPVARLVTREVRVPTIGIGAGVGTSGQVQVFHDILGLYDRVVPRFSRQFALLEEPMRRALATYCAAVKARTFPAAEHSFGMPPAEVQELERQFGHALEIGDTPVNGAASGRASRSADEPGRSGKAPPARAAPASGGQAGPDGLKVVHSVEEWRQLQRSPRLRAVASVGLVPTMGALHAGHLALVERARRENELVVASIFVNPKQFGEGEDLAKYPRTWEEDVNRLRAAGADVLFAPTESEMYPQAVGEPCVYVDVAGLDGAAEAARRPGHFKGVATVVTKLLNIIQPSTAYFGQKGALCYQMLDLLRTP